MASKIKKIENDFIEAVNASQKKTSAYDTEAEIVRVSGDTAWVHIAGGVAETPVKLTINAKKGDTVQVRVSNEGAWIMGNATAPPTDDAVAKEAKEEISETNVILKDVKTVAEQTQKIAGDTNQYFWHTETGTDTGAHITEIPQKDFIADPQNGGGNLLARSNGIAVRDGLVELASFGTSATIGVVENSDHVIVGNGGVSMYTSQGVIYFESSVDESVTKQQRIGKTTNIVDTLSPIVTVSSTSTPVTTQTKTLSITDVIPVEDWNALANGESFKVVTAKANYWYGSYIYRIDPLVISFTKGTSQTKTDTLYWSELFEYKQTITLVYDATNNTITYSIKLEWISGSDYAQIAFGISELYYTKETPLSIVKMSGDCYINNDEIGATYMGIESNGSSSAPATSGDDKDFFNAIYNLGWYSDVIV